MNEIEKAQQLLATIPASAAHNWESICEIGEALQGVSFSLFNDWLAWLQNNNSFYANDPKRLQTTWAVDMPKETEKGLPHLEYWAINRETSPLSRTLKGRKLDWIATRFGSGLRYNKMNKQVELDSKPIEPDFINFNLLEEGFDVGSKDFAIDAFYYLAKKNSYHPVVDYLNQCYEKYGDSTIHLLDAPSARYLGTTESLYDTFLKKTLISAAARAFEPGCDVQTVLILQGKQDIGKSTFFRILGGEWFDDSLSDRVGDKDELLKLHSAWITEWGELDRVFSRRDIGTVKSFVSSRSDNFRQPFGKVTETNWRQGIIVGSTNTNDFLLDPTGARRYLVIPVTEFIDFNLLKEEVEQLWAAVVALYKKGHDWHLSRIEKAANEKNNQHFERDEPWAKAIIDFLACRLSITTSEILSDCLKIELSRQDRAAQMRVADVLKSLGWIKKHTKAGKIWQQNESLAEKGSHGSHQNSESLPDIDNNGDYLKNKGSQGSHNYNYNNGSKLNKTSCDHLEDIDQVVSDYLVTPEVVTTQIHTESAIQVGGDYVTTESDPKTEKFSESLKNSGENSDYLIKVGDRVVIKNLTEILKKSKLNTKMQTAVYEVRQIYSDSLTARCVAHANWYVFPLDCLGAIEHG